MLYIIEPRTETNKVEAVGFPGISHYYGENSVTYKDEKGDKGEITVSIGSIVNCNGTPGVVTEVVTMKFGRVILTVKLDHTPKTTTGALMR